MKLETIATHTLLVDLLHPGDFVVDAGCRDFDFTEAMIEMGFEVFSIDPDEKVWSDWPKLDVFGCCALVGIGKPNAARFIEAGNGSRIAWDGPCQTPTITIVEIIERFGKPAVVKLDIEGSEYDVLLTWPGPVAGQISVEYHEHTQQGKAIHGNDVYERIAKHLGQWYELVKDDPMDTLWVLK